LEFVMHIEAELFLVSRQLPFESIISGHTSNINVMLKS
jgi:hypothetical protein